MIKALTIYLEFLLPWVGAIALMLVFPVALVMCSTPGVDGNPVMFWGGLASSVGGLCWLNANLANMSRGKW